MKTNIAIVRRNGLGDFIVGAIPLYNCMLENNRNNSVFYFFLSAINCPLHKYFVDEERDKVAVFDRGNKYFSVISMACKYRNIIDKGYLTMPDYPKLTGLFLFLMGVKDIYGYINNSLLARLTINRGIRNSNAYNSVSKHIALLSIQLYDKSINRIEKRWYPKFNKSKIKGFNISLKGPFLMVELSNNREYSQLNSEKLYEILCGVYLYYKFTVLITAKKADEMKVKALSNMLSKKRINSYSYITDDLDDYISYVNKADLVLVGDGGLGHIAGALDKYVVALYGMTSVELWGILSDKAIIIYDKENVNNISNDRIIRELCKRFENLKTDTSSSCE